MPDLNLEWRGDLSFGPSNDLAVVDGDDFVRQRIERRLFTAVQGYVFHLEYGAGVPQKIGELYQPHDIAAIIRGQMLLEDSVAQDPPPRIQAWTSPEIQGGMIVRIDYTEAASGRQIGLTITF